MADPKPGAQRKADEDAKAKEAAEAKRQAEEAERRAAAVQKRTELGLPDDATEAQVEAAEDDAAARAASEDKAEEAPRFAVEDILANARVKFRVSRHILAGALSKADQKTFTDEEVKERVKKFTSRKIGEEEKS